VNCDAAKAHWLDTGLTRGYVASRRFSILDRLARKPLLQKFFGDNYRQAWHYFRYVQSETPFVTYKEPDYKSKGRQVFLVDDFSDGSGNWAPALARALAAAHAYTGGVNGANSAEIRFGPHTYAMKCFNGEGNPYFVVGTYCFVIRGLSRVLFNGVEGQSKITIDNPEMGLAQFWDGQQIFVQNLAFDIETAPFIQGKIVELRRPENGSVSATVWIDNSFPHIGLPELKRAVLGRGNGEGEGNFILMDRTAPHRKIGSNSFVKADAIEATDSADHLTFDFTTPSIQLQSLSTQAEVNDQFVYTLRHGGAMLSFQRNNTIGLNKIMIHASSTVSIIFQLTTGSVRLNQVIIRPESIQKKIISSSAGGIYYGYNRASVLMQNCYFDGLTDDAMATHGGGAFVSGVESPSRIRLKTNREILVGDLLQFVNPENGELLGETSALTVTKMATGQPGFILYDVTLALEVNGMNSGDGQAPRRGTIFNNTVVYNVSLSAPDSLFRDNIFGYNRGAALRIRGPRSRMLRNDVMLAGTTGIESMSLIGSYILGPIPSQIEITDNFIYGGTTLNSAHIAVGKQTLGQPVTPNDVQVLINGNRLVRPNPLSIHVLNVIGVTEVDNGVEDLVP
jgi:hypothetical protein